MYQFFTDPSQIHTEDKRVIITGSDVNHIRNVLRMKVGEEIAVRGGADGREYRCGILEMREDEVICELRFIKEEGVELPSKVYLFQGLPKADKMEFIIQKAVELGVCEVIPMSLGRCVVKLDEKKEKNKLARWQQIAEAAAKQSKRGIIPQVKNVMSLKQALVYLDEKQIKVRLIPYELAEGMEKTRSIIDGLIPGEDVAIFIGPEGGFEEHEIKEAMDKDVTPITLGKRILRTETAGMCVLSWIMYRLEE